MNTKKIFQLTNTTNNNPFNFKTFFDGWDESNYDFKCIE